MAELTRDETRYYHLSDVEEYPVAAGVTVYEGAAVGENGSGYARPLVAGDPFLGFASKRASNSAGIAGAERVPVKTNGLVKLLVTGVTVAANKGAEVYASNDGTFTVSAYGNSKIGKVHKVESDSYALVRIDVASGASAKIRNYDTNNTFNPGINTIADDIVSASALGGTASYPNRVGHELFTSEVAGDGVTSSFVLAAGFIVNDVTWENISVLVRLSTGAYTATTPTVTDGYGTTSVTVSLSPTPAASSTIFFKIIGENPKTGTAANQAAILGGYDNVSNKLMSQINGSHCFIDGTGTGHDVISGGSYHAIKNSTYSNVCGGTYNRIYGSDNATIVGGVNNYILSSAGAITGGVQNAIISSNYAVLFGTLLSLSSSSYSIAAGRLHTITGTDAAVFGNGMTVTGNSSIAAGYQNSETAYSAVFGRSNVMGGDYSFSVGYSNISTTQQHVVMSGYLGKAQTPGERFFSHGAVGKAAGLRQSSNVTLAVRTTNATETIMTALQAQTNIKVSTDCAAYVTGKLVAYNEDKSEAASFNVQALLKYSGGTGTLIYSNCPIQGGSAITWSARVVEGASRFDVRVTGGAAKNIQWFADINVVFVDVAIA